jgi:hypothetical protein
LDLERHHLTVVELAVLALALGLVVIPAFLRLLVKLGWG